MDLRELHSVETEDVARPWVATPPPSALVVPQHENRPVRALRELARDPVRALKEAAAAWAHDRTRASAMAEMAVTGRGAASTLAALDLRAGDLGSSSVGSEVLGYVERLRAYLAAGPVARAAMIPALLHEKQTFLPAGYDAPWLAVAAEIDAPWRPVNVGISHHALADVDVDVSLPTGGVVRVTARYARAGDLAAERGIVLLLHGLGSRLEEVDVVADALAARGLGVVSVDLPSQGYSSRVSPEHVGDPARGTYVMPEWDRDEGYAYLAFTERFVVGFVEALGLRDRLVAIGGGSLGGTLALRVAIHAALGPNVRSIAWSPGSVWGTQQTNWVNWAAIEATAGRRLWMPEQLADDERRGVHDSRTDYIRWIFDAPIALLKPQPTLWFKGMPREAEHTAAARADRRELYDHAHRIACLALAYEQTIYSITETPRGHSVPRYARIGTPVLVMAGSRDDDMLDIHREVGKLASRMRSHGRRGRIVRLDACHSIHEERPRALAREIDAFLSDTTF